jgi:multiple sugar transport system ATP-binding protein
VGPPAELFDHPENLFVAGFIGSPAMNLVYGRVEGEGDSVYAVFPGARLKVGRKSLDLHPGLENHMNKQLVIGLRPSNMEAAAVAGSSPERSLTANVEVTEMLGADTYIHFDIDSPPVVTPDIEELLADTGRDVDSLGDQTSFVARVSPDVQVKQGDQIELVVDTDKLHFFDLEGGYRIGFKKAAEAAAS